MATFSSIAGQRFERLVVQSLAEIRPNGSYWNCLCDCGTLSVVAITKLRSGRTKSCGCLRKEKTAAAKKTHGLTRKHPLYGMYAQIRGRCMTETNHAFHNYGGRGISVCDRWLKGEDGLTGFECFVADMGDRPHPSMSIERRDNDGPYSPDNCIWATAKDQARNRRTNRLVSVGGRTLCLAEACEALGLDEAFIRNRITLGFDWERAITQPKRERRVKAEAA